MLTLYAALDRDVNLTKAMRDLVFDGPDIGALLSYATFRTADMRDYRFLLRSNLIADSGAFTRYWTDPMLFVRNPIEDVVRYYHELPFRKLAELDSILPGWKDAGTIGLLRAKILCKMLPEEMAEKIMWTIQGTTAEEAKAHMNLMMEKLESAPKHYAVGSSWESEEDLKGILQFLADQNVKSCHVYSTTGHTYIDLVSEFVGTGKIENISVDGRTWQKKAYDRAVWVKRHDNGDMRLATLFFKTGTAAKQDRVDELDSCMCDVCCNRIPSLGEPTKLMKLGQIARNMQAGRESYTKLFKLKASLHNLCMIRDYMRWRQSHPI